MTTLVQIIFVYLSCLPLSFLISARSTWDSSQKSYERCFGLFPSTSVALACIYLRPLVRLQVNHKHFKNETPAC
jgi:hypothetical protein